jgi:hypothetical protein
MKALKVIYHPLSGNNFRTVQSKLDDILSPADIGAVGDGSSDDTDYLEAVLEEAIARALARTAMVTVDLAGRTYGISSTITLTDAKYIRIVNGGLVAIGSSWAATDPILEIAGTGALDARRVCLADLYIDLSEECSGPKFSNTWNCSVDDCFIVHAAPTGNHLYLSGGNNTEFRSRGANLLQWIFGETGYDDVSQRTADGLVTESADGHFTDLVANYCALPLNDSGALNNYIGCHFYNGATSSGTDNICAYVSDSNNTKFVGCYFDNGILKFTGAEHRNSVVGCHFQKTGTGNNNSAIELETTTAGDVGGGLLITGNRFNFNSYSDGYVKFTTSGGGSWASVLTGADISGNAAFDGTVLAAYGRRMLSSGTAASPGLGFAADANNGLYYISTDRWGLSAGGVLALDLQSGLIGVNGGMTGNTQDLNGAGAVNLTTLTTKWGTTGADAGTLADGAPGQFKIIMMDADGGDGTLTPSNFGNGTTITFDDVGDTVLLQFINTNWWLLSNVGCAIA